MKLTDIQLDLAAAYIKEELSGKALTDFEVAIAMNEVLREEVAFQRGILGALRLNVAVATSEQAMLKNMLEDGTLHPDFEHTQRVAQQARIDNINRQRRIRNWVVSGLAAAACVVLVSIVGLKAYLNGQLDGDIAELVVTVDSERIPLTEGIKDVSTRHDVVERKLNRAKEAFKKRDWKTTLSVFDTLRTQYKYNSAEMDFYEAVILYNEKEYTKSIKKIESINIKEAQSPCEIRHFLTLSYLKIKNKTKAKEQYEMLSRSSQKCDKHTIKQLKKYFIL